MLAQPTTPGRITQPRLSLILRLAGAQPRTPRVRAVVPVIADDVEAARRERRNADDPDAKLRALKREFRRERDGCARA